RDITLRICERKPCGFWVFPSPGSGLDVGCLRVPHCKEVIADAALHERSLANDDDLLKPGVLGSTRLELQRGHVVVLLRRALLSSQPAGKHRRNLDAIAPVRHIEEGAIVRLPSHPPVEFPNSIETFQYPITTGEHLTL